jgi:hypothetical protein
MRGCVARAARSPSREDHRAFGALFDIVNGRSDSIAESSCLKVIVPHVEIDGILRLRLLAPQLACREADRIDVLRLFAKEMSGGVREDKDAVIAIDDAEFGACGARQPRVADRSDVTRAHVLAYGETRRHRDDPAARRARWLALFSVIANELISEGPARAQLASSARCAPQPLCA